MKRLFTILLIVMSLMVSGVAYAQQTVKHVVKKGETIASIAANYGITAKDIIALNPRAERFVFVGMELQIPKVAASTASVPQAAVTVPEENTYTRATVNEKYKAAPYKDQQSVSTGTSTINPSFRMRGNLGYDLSLEEKPENTSVWGASVFLLLDEYFTDKFYCGQGLGFAIGESTAKMDPYKTTSTSYSLLIPLYVGFSPIDGLDLDTGPSFNWLVGGSTVVYDGSKKISEYKFNDDKDLKRFVPTWRVSVRLCDFVHITLNIGLKKNSGSSMTFGLSF